MANNPYDLLFSLLLLDSLFHTAIIISILNVENEAQRDFVIQPRASAHGKEAGIRS